MRKNKIHTILMAVGMLTVLASCQRQGDEPTLQSESETMNVKFNTFLKEGDNVRPLNLGTRSTGEATLNNGFYLYGHAHTKSFATASGNTYTPIFENVKISADGTYVIPKFWLQDKSLLYSFQAFAATGPLSKEVGPGVITVSSNPPYVSSVPAVDYLVVTDVLGAAVFDIKMGDEVPTVNLYFEHRLAKLSLQLQRMNAGGPTLYNLTLTTTSLTAMGKVSTAGWAPGSTIVPTQMDYWSGLTSDAITLPASKITPVEVSNYIFPPQELSPMFVTVSYTLDPGDVSVSNPKITLTAGLPALKLESGKQLNVVIGHIVESEQIVVKGVTLTDWVTVDKDVPVYGG